MLDRQLVFTDVVIHLLTQNAKSEGEKEDGNFSCMYRGPNGLKCAIGVLIPDDKYCSGIEGEPANFVRNRLDSKYGNALISDVTFLRSLQVIHDTKPVKDWKKELQKFAHEYKLTMSEGY